MTTNAKRLIAISGVTIVVLGTGAYLARGTLFPQQDEADRILAQVRETPDEERFAQMRKIREQAESLNDEQRDRVREGMRGMFMEYLDERISEYEDAAEEDKVAVLDKHLDEFMKRREQWRAERERRRAERESAGEGDGAGGPGARGGEGGNRDGGPGAREGRGGRGRGAPSIERRKQRMEGRNPDSEVRRMRYFMKIRDRAQERGIEMGRGPGGRGSPRGGRM